MNKNGLIFTSLMVVLIAAGIAVKMIWFPSVKEAWFLNGARGLRQAPEGVIVVRPTHYPQAPTNWMVSANVKGKNRMVGRNVTLQQLIAVAYNYNAARVSVPPEAKGNFDFLVTGPQDHLRAVVLSRTGYSAKEETTDTDVLALKVDDPNSPGLKPSGPDEKQNGNVSKGRLYLTHMKLSTIAPGLEQVLKTPVVDETGLTNYYDFSLAWSRNMRPDQLTREQLDKIVGEWGLKFEPDTETVKMLVVKKTG